MALIACFMLTMAATKLRFCMKRLNVSFEICFTWCCMPQWGIFNFNSTWTEFVCVLRLLLRGASYSQWGQLNFIPSWTDWMCALRLPFSVVSHSQLGLLDFVFSCTDRVCWLGLPLYPALCPQWRQLGSVRSWGDWMCLLRSAALCHNCEN